MCSCRAGVWYCVGVIFISSTLSCFWPINWSETLSSFLFATLLFHHLIRKMKRAGISNLKCNENSLIIDAYILGQCWVEGIFNLKRDGNYTLTVTYWGDVPNCLRTSRTLKNWGQMTISLGKGLLEFIVTRAWAWLQLHLLEKRESVILDLEKVNLS